MVSPVGSYKDLQASLGWVEKKVRVLSREKVGDKREERDFSMSLLERQSGKTDLHQVSEKQTWEMGPFPQLLKPWKRHLLVFVEWAKFRVYYGTSFAKHSH